MAERPLIRRSFLTINASWTVKKTLNLMEQFEKSKHAIVYRVDRLETLYYLYKRSMIQSLLMQNPGSATVQEALDLHEYDATPVFDINAPVESLPRQGIVKKEGNLVGFFEPVTRGVDNIDIGIGGESTLSTFYLNVNFPQEVQLEEEASLLVSISLHKNEASREKELPVAVPKNSQIDIIVQPKEGFQLVGAGEGSLIATDSDEPLPLQFKLKAIQIGTGVIRVIAFFKGQPLGAIRIEAIIGQKTRARAAARLSTFETSLSAPIPASPQPDLSLLILETTDKYGKPALSFRLSSTDPKLGLNFKEFGPTTLHMEPSEYFKDFFAGIENLPVGTPEEKLIAEQRVSAKGVHLFNTVIPADLQTLLWSLKDRIGSVWVQSEEPWIPWEICKLKGNENGKIVEGKFLCEAYPITRWIPGIKFTAGLSAKKMGIVVPSDSGLPFASDEKKALLAMKNAARQIEPVPATFLELTKTMAAGTYDIWHFTGHGGFQDPDPNRAGILLEKEETLTPEDLSGEIENLGCTSPLVFLNACQVGRGGMSLTEIGGMAKKFLSIGAGAFVGAHWSIYDKAANNFAIEFYKQLFAGVPVGKAAQAARLAIKPLGDPTWLAYTVFATPFTAIT